MRRWVRSSYSAVRRDALRCTQHSRSFSCSRAQQQRVTISSLLASDAHRGEIEVAGWVRTIRKQKQIAFLALGDGSTSYSLQAILKPEDADRLTSGTAVRLTGDWVQSSGRGQANELKVTKVEVCGDNDAKNNPIQPKYQSLEFMRTIPHLRPRIASNAILLRLRSEMIAATTSWFQGQGFVQCHTPIITSSDCEGAGEVFAVVADEESTIHSTLKDATQPFFKTPKYLTVSSQLHLEALAQAVDKVWTLSPTFRAEKSDTPRHLSEFYMLEAELCFIRSADEVMDVVEDMLRGVSSTVMQTSVYSQLLSTRQKAADHVEQSACSSEAVQGRWEGLQKREWPRITYEQAIAILTQAHESGDHPFVIKPVYNDGLAAEHERYLADVVGRGSPIFVTNYPAIQKPFYMAPSDGETVACFDLLVPDICELVGGSVREHRLHNLQRAMSRKGMSGENLEWYQDLRRYGSVPHGGFGLGFDRLLCYLAGVASVRDMVSFPRYYGRADC